MLRFRVVAFTLCSLILALMLAGPQEVRGQSKNDAEEAARTAVRLSELESGGSASPLYRRMHSDAREIIPKETVIGWYESDFFPLDPQPITEVTGVEFVTWTWPVTGKSYRNTAEVSYIQPFGTGNGTTYVEETVRLVEEDGDWRWFFGRSTEFVDEQIARFSEAPASSESPSRTAHTPSTTEMSSVYSLPVTCSNVEAMVGGVVYAYCDWPFMLSAPFYCVVAALDSASGMAMFMCNPSSVPDFQNPDEVMLDFAPKLVYTVQVHCDIYKEGYQKYTYCDWPWGLSFEPECVVDESRLTFPYEQWLLCKP